MDEKIRTRIRLKEKEPEEPELLNTKPFLQKKKKIKTSENPERNGMEAGDQVFHLQKIMGNRAVQRIIKDKTFQAKLEVGKPNDAYEREANQVADSVTAGLPAPPISRIPPGGLDNTPQKQENQEENLQTKLVQCREIEEEEPDQAQGFRGQEIEEEEAGVDTSAASRAINHKSGGTPLDPSMQKTLESSMGADLSDVRLHNDRTAHDAADALNARAFTHGSDIWLGKGESADDLGLMAHEAAHVVQQGSGVQRKTIQLKNDNKKSGPNVKPVVEDNKVTSTAGTIDEGKKTISIPAINIPPFKVILTPGPLSLSKKSPDEKRDTKQVQIWETAAGKSGIIDNKIKEKYSSAGAPAKKVNQTYFFRLRGNKSQYVFGKLDTLKKTLIRPFWNEDGKMTFYHVDHKKEIQLGGPDAIDNMWLLKDKVNMSSGGLIKTEVKKKVEKVAATAVESNLWDKPKDYKTIRQQYAVTVRRTEKGTDVKGKPIEKWELKDIQAGKSLKGLKPLVSEEELKEVGVTDAEGSQAEKLLLFTREVGGTRKEIDLKDIGKGGLKKKFGKNFEIDKVVYDPNTGGTIFGNAFPTKGKKKGTIIEEAKLDFPIKKLDWGNYVGYIPSGSVTAAARKKLKVLGLSPIEILEAILSAEKGLEAIGKILPTVPLFKDIDIDIVMDGDNVSIRKKFDTGDFAFPGPVQVTESSLEIFAGTKGIGFKGEVFVEVERVGKGKLWGTASTGTGQGGSAALGGEFEFDTKLFDEAKIILEYINNLLKGSGILKTNKGKVKGIKSASFNVNVNGENWAASGTVEPEIPGIKKGNISAKYDKEKGFEIGALLEFTDEIPGLKSGSMEVYVLPDEKGEGYVVKATGGAQLDISGIDAEIKGEYNAGLFSAETKVVYEKGMLKGILVLGVTNRKVNEKGELIGEPGETLIVYGSGSATIKISSWLQGTAGLKLHPNGEVEVTGDIGIPNTIDVFPEKKLDKRLFSIDIKIPILGFTVAGKGVGIFAVIGGGLDLMAGFGPGQLRECKITVNYNPDREEETTVSGKALFVVPANAGLRLFVKAGVGASLLIVSAELGVEIGAFLGVEGEARASVEVDWNPKTGLTLEATGEVFAEPKFKFDITGYAMVEADLLFTSIELYEKRWKFAEFEFGSGLRVGAKFPIKYQEGEPFDISLDDVEFEYPDVDAMELLEGLFDEIT